MKTTKALRSNEEKTKSEDELITIGMVYNLIQLCDAITERDITLTVCVAIDKFRKSQALEILLDNPPF